MWVYANPNPRRQEEPDCVIRAIAIATNQSWEKVHWDLCMLSHQEYTMPSANWLWGKYLAQNGFKRFELPESCPECVTVEDFANRFHDGIYIIGTGSHAVAVISGDWYDTWDSFGEAATYFYKKKRSD